MAGAEDGGGEKTFDATPQKIEKARKKGDIAKSADFSVAMAYLGLLVAVVVFGRMIVLHTAGGLEVFLASPDRLHGRILGPGGMLRSANIVFGAIAPVLALLLIPAVFVLLSLILQRGFTVAPEKIAPKLNRISPLSGLKNKFGVTGLVEFAKTFIKMLAVVAIVGFYLNKNLGTIMGLSRAAPTDFAVAILSVMVDLLTSITVFAVVVGLGDLLWQHFNHARKLRMSLREMKDESKESEGDPHTKAQRRQRGREIATNRMLLDVPDADVVVVNPTHFAVALKWTRARGSAPKCVAKGEGEVAARIRELASASGVPIHNDPPIARAIYATVEIGNEIDPDHYRAIAAAMRFADVMRRKARNRGRS